MRKYSSFFQKKCIEFGPNTDYQSNYMSESILINVLCYNFVIAIKATGT